MFFYILNRPLYYLGNTRGSATKSFLLPNQSWLQSLHPVRCSKGAIAIVEKVGRRGWESKVEVAIIVRATPNSILFSYPFGKAIGFLSKSSPCASLIIEDRRNHEKINDVTTGSYLFYQHSTK